MKRAILKTGVEDAIGCSHKLDRHDQYGIGPILLATFLMSSKSIRKGQAENTIYLITMMSDDVV